jgi:hypothetical protein
MVTCERAFILNAIQIYGVGESCQGFYKFDRDPDVTERSHAHTPLRICAYVAYIWKIALSITDAIGSYMSQWWMSW